MLRVCFIYCRNLIKKPWALVRVPYMVIGPGFLNQVPTSY